MSGRNSGGAGRAGFLSPLIFLFLFLCILFYLIFFFSFSFSLFRFLALLFFLEIAIFFLLVPSWHSTFLLVWSSELNPWFFVDSLDWIISYIDFDKCVEPTVYSAFMDVCHFMTLWAYLGLHEWIHLYTILFSFLCDIASHECCFLELALIHFEIVCSHVCMNMIEEFLLFHLLNHTTILYTNFPCQPLWAYIFPFFHLTHYKPKHKTIFVIFFDY